MTASALYTGTVRHRRLADQPASSGTPYVRLPRSRRAARPARRAPRALAGPGSSASPARSARRSGTMPATSRRGPASSRAHRAPGRRRPGARPDRSAHARHRLQPGVLLLRVRRARPPRRRRRRGHQHALAPAARLRPARRPRDARCAARSNEKALHVSPFQDDGAPPPLGRSAPGPTLSLHIENRRRDDGALDFDATLSLRRQPLTPRAPCAHRRPASRRDPARADVDLRSRAGAQRCAARAHFSRPQPGARPMTAAQVLARRIVLGLLRRMTAGASSSRAPTASVHVLGPGGPPVSADRRPRPARMDSAAARQPRPGVRSYVDGCWESIRPDRGRPRRGAQRPGPGRHAPPHALRPRALPARCAALRRVRDPLPVARGHPSRTTTSATTSSS